jgi:DNA-binding FadR family transcriptional regulator
MHTLEPTMTRLASVKPDPQMLKRLDDNIAATRAAMQRGESLVELDIEFHSIIATMSGNRALSLAREPLGRLFFPSFKAVMSSVPAAGKRLVDAHQAIADSIRARDAGNAEAWMQKHIRDFKRGYQLAKLDVRAPIVGPRNRGGVSPA